MSKEPAMTTKRTPRHAGTYRIGAMLWGRKAVYEAVCEADPQAYTPSRTRSLR